MLINAAYKWMGLNDTRDKEETTDDLYYSTCGQLDVPRVKKANLERCAVPNDESGKTAGQLPHLAPRQLERLLHRNYHLIVEYGTI